MRAEFVNQTGAPWPCQFLSKWVEAVWRELQRRRAIPARAKGAKVLRLVYVPSGLGKKLNRQFRQKAYATDVLSFEPIESGELGELVLCRQVIRRQAEEHGLPLREELAYLVLHGMLHLLGFEHEQGGVKARRMYQIQDEVFESLIDRVR